MSKAVFKTNLQIRSFSHTHIWIWLKDFSSVDYSPVVKSQSKRGVEGADDLYVSVQLIYQCKNWTLSV